MQIALISSKRQVTLSKALLDQYGAKPGTKLIMQPLSDGFFVKPMKNSVVEDVAGRLTDHIVSSKRGKSLKSIEAETKKIVSEKLATE